MAEPPEMRPAAPDVKQEVQTDSTNYMPGVVKPPQEDQTNLQEQEEYEEVEEVFNAFNEDGFEEEEN